MISCSITCLRHLFDLRNAIAKTRVKPLTVNLSRTNSKYCIKNHKSVACIRNYTHFVHWLSVLISFLFYFCIRNDLQKMYWNWIAHAVAHPAIVWIRRRWRRRQNQNSFDTFSREFKTFGYNFIFRLENKKINNRWRCLRFCMYFNLDFFLLLSFASVNVISLWILLFVLHRPLGKMKH